jgi:hypothetical protein
MSPFEEGYDCCDSGGFIEENPYVTHTTAWREWYDGFVECDDSYSDDYHYEEREDDDWDDSRYWD